MDHASHETSERLWLVLESLAVAHPDMGFKDGVLLAQKVAAEIDWMREEGISKPPDLSVVPPLNWSAEVLGAWAGRQEIVNQLLEEDKKINAIKELRSLTGAGLKQAKDAIEWLADWKISRRSGL